MSIDYAVEKKTQRQRVLDLLSDLEWHSFRMLHEVGGIRYSARLLELKRLGYVIEDRDTGQAFGKQYRLTSLTLGEPQGKRVKVFLSEWDVESMIDDSEITDSARAALADALGSFRANKGKL